MCVHFETLISPQAVHPSYWESYTYTHVYVKYFYYIFYSKDNLKVAQSPSVEEGFKWYSVPTGHHCVVVRNEQSALYGVMCKNTSGIWLAAKSKLQNCKHYIHVHIHAYTYKHPLVPRSSLEGTHHDVDSGPFWGGGTGAEMELWDSGDNFHPIALTYAHFLHQTCLTDT